MYSGQGRQDGRGGQDGYDRQIERGGQGRHELKHYINYADYLRLRAGLRAVAELDGHAGVDGGYAVRSLYFDNYADRAVMDKLSGLSRREKFRLRYYNGDTSFIRLEKKSKANRLVYKESAAIEQWRCAALLAGEYGCLNDRGAPPLYMELYAKMRYQCLRPKSIVDYYREAYVCRAGNVRVTFDSKIKASDSVTCFMNPHSSTVPASGAIILEIKYDRFMPDMIADRMRACAHNQIEFSKYVAARVIY